MLNTYCNQSQDECDGCLYYREDECKAKDYNTAVEGRDLTDIIQEV